MSKRSGPLLAALVLAIALGITACGDDPAADGGAGIARGGELFDNNCAVCHGDQGTGTVTGPPLVHEIYEPGHHPDASFQRAVQEGVPQHHWDFGPMPAVPGLDDSQVDDIIVYVRELQRDAGIID